MRILFDINHPADVHQFKHPIQMLKKDKHQVLVVARDKDVVFELLRMNHITYKVRKGYQNKFAKLLGIPFIDWQLYRMARSFRADVLVGSSGDIYVAHAAKLLGKPSLIFDDTEHSTVQNYLCFPFATRIFTPESYLLELGDKQIRYPGYKEHGYLSSRYFRPSSFKKDGKLIFIRLVSWDASHDIGKKGIPDVRKLILQMEKKGTVMINSEKPLPAGMKKYEMAEGMVNRIHDILYNADLVISEGGTVAVEAAVLGTPTIYANELKMGYVEDLKKKGRMVQTTDEKEIQKHALRMLSGKRRPIYDIDFDVNGFIVREILRCRK